MEILISKKAEKEMEDLDPNTRKIFFQHIEKIVSNPFRRHMKFGLPFNVEGVTKQGRIVYEIKKDTCYILHCFGSHKDYERWYKSLM